MSHSTLLDQIIREFGSRESVIERAFTICESFRALCRDYSACSRALAGFRNSVSKEDGLREAEYSELLQELAVEIETRLNAVGSIPANFRSRRSGSKKNHMTESKRSFAHED